jgi:hypothetical protein
MNVERVGQFSKFSGFLFYFPEFSNHQKHVRQEFPKGLRLTLLSFFHIITHDMTQSHFSDAWVEIDHHEDSRSNKGGLGIYSDVIYTCPVGIKFGCAGSIHEPLGNKV